MCVTFRSGGCPHHGTWVSPQDSLVRSVAWRLPSPRQCSPLCPPGFFEASDGLFLTLLSSGEGPAWDTYPQGWAWAGKSRQPHHLEVVGRDGVPPLLLPVPRKREHQRDPCPPAHGEWLVPVPGQQYGQVSGARVLDPVVTPDQNWGPGASLPASGQPVPRAGNVSWLLGTLSRFSVEFPFKKQLILDLCTGTFMVEV